MVKRSDRLPGLDSALLLGEGRDLFPALLPGVPSVVSLDCDAPPQTVFLGKNDSPEGRESLRECIERKVPFIIIGKGWPRGIPSSLRIQALREGCRILGPGSGGLVTPALSGDDSGRTALLAEGKDLFQRTWDESCRRSVPLLYAFSLGEKSDLSPFEAARAILGIDRRVLFFVFILERLRDGRKLLEFASEAAGSGKRVGLLEFDPRPGEDRVKTSALRQYGIARLYEPSQVVDSAAAFHAVAGKRYGGIFSDAGQGEMARLLRSEGARKGVPFLEKDDGQSPVLKVLRQVSDFPFRKEGDSFRRRPLVISSVLSVPGYEMEGEKTKIPFIPGIGRCLDALALTFAPEKPRGGEPDVGSAVPRCPIHPRPTEYDAKVLLGAFGLPVARERLCRSFSEAADAAEAIGYPVALKVMSPTILHKTEARVVALNLQDREELRNAYGRTLEKARIADPGARIRGVLVQEMVRGGTEWRMEFRRDPRFGPVVETGISGVYTEILPDGVIRVAPFDEKEAMEMIGESKGYPLLLEGWRRERLDIEAFAKALSAFSRLAFCEREVARLDINPLFVNRKGVLVVDAFIEKKGRKK